MQLPYFSFSSPKTTQELFEIIASSNEKVMALAGGTDLIPRMKYGLVSPPVVVGVSNVSELKGIVMHDGAMHIGAITTLSEIIASPIVKSSFPALHQAAASIATPSIWNVATIGGNICQDTRCLFYNQSRAWRKEQPPCLKAGGNVCHAIPKGRKCLSVYQGDLAPAIIAHGGMAEVRGMNKSRTIPLQELFTNDPKKPIGLEKEEFVTKVIIPATDETTRSCYKKMRMRSSVDYPLVSVAVVLTRLNNGRIGNIRIVLGATAGAPLILEEAEQILKGDYLNDDLLERVGDKAAKKVRLVDNLTSPASYRHKMFAVFTKRAIKAALENQY